MITLWTSHLRDPEDKERFEKSIQSSKSVLDRLKDILEGRLKAIDIMETSLEAYSSPNWDYKQAHYNGSKAELKALLRVINLDQKEI